MTLKDELKKKLKKELNEDELNLLPSGYQMIGSIIILNIKIEVFIFTILNPTDNIFFKIYQKLDFLL